jgi:hypothetical protein
MSKKALLLIALFVFVVCRIPAYAAGPSGDKTFAQAWTGYSDKEKRSFLFGVATSARAICTDISTMQKDASAQTIETTFRDCFNSYAGVDPDRLIAAMTTLYNDPKNAMIPIDGAYKISLMQVRGDKVDEIIVQARKYGEGIKKELDQQRKKTGK